MGPSSDIGGALTVALGHLAALQNCGMAGGGGPWYTVFTERGQVGSTLSPDPSFCPVLSLFFSPVFFLFSSLFFFFKFAFFC